MLLLPQSLKIGLVVASNLVTEHDKGKVLKDVAMFRCHLEQVFCQLIVEPLLLDTVIETRVTQILFAIGNQEAFQLECIRGSDGGVSTWSNEACTAGRVMLFVPLCNA